MSIILSWSAEGSIGRWQAAEQAVTDAPGHARALPRRPTPAGVEIDRLDDALGHVQATRSNGEKADYWVRVTVAFEKRNGEWSMIHDHVSMPFDMKTAKAVRQLRP